MEKKIIQAMFTNICSTDQLRPPMTGVHFEKERCYASDGHLLTIYKKGSESLDGKTMNVDGVEIEGRYPNIDSVFPAQQGEKFVTDFVQLKNACIWHLRQKDSHDRDAVVIENIGLNIENLARLLSTITLIGDPRNITFFLNGGDKAVVIESDDMQSLLMPTLFKEEEIDLPREEDGYITMSYENFINDYVFNSWKKPEKKQPLNWLG